MTDLPKCPECGEIRDGWIIEVFGKGTLCANCGYRSNGKKDWRTIESLRSDLEFKQSEINRLNEESAVLRNEINDKDQEIGVSEKVIASYKRLVDMFECPKHGECIPFACDEVERMRDELSALKSERIICAAVKRGDKVYYGHRHPNAMKAALDHGCERPIHGNEMGFVTSMNRFVDRVEAYKIAVSAGQYNRKSDCTDKELYSEDLY